MLKSLFEKWYYVLSEPREVWLLLPQSRPSADAVHSYGSLTDRNEDTSLRTCGGVSGTGKRLRTWEGPWRQREGIFGDFPHPQYSADWNQSLYIMKVEDPFLDFQMIKSYSLLRNNDEIVWMTCEDYMKRRKTFSYFLCFWLLRCLFFNNLWLFSDFVFSLLVCFWIC